MKVLVVCSGNFPDPDKNFAIHQAFIYDQMQALSRYYNITYEIYLIKGKGFIGYLSNINKLRRKINQGQFDLVHAHYSLSGLVSIIASPIPVVITFHGSDINKRMMSIISSLTAFWAKHVICVSNKMLKKAFIKTSKSSVIPCGIDFDVFYPQPKADARNIEGMDLKSKYILFCSSFNIPVKNSTLAKRAIEMLDDDIIMLELKDRTRDMVRNIINASDVLLMTSFSEGSPQVIKEAMACNCPIVATDVGDVREVISDTEGCFISSNDPYDIALKIKKALMFQAKTCGREKIMNFDNKKIAEKVYQVYENAILTEKKK